MGLQMPRTLGECFQLAIRVEEKLKRKQERQGNGGRGGRGRGGRINWEQGQSNEKGKETSSDSRGGYRGGGRFGAGRGTFTRRYFNCNKVGNPSFKCPKWEQSDRGRDRRVNLTQEEEKKEENEPLKESILLEGEFLILNKGKLQQ